MSMQPNKQSEPAETAQSGALPSRVKTGIGGLDHVLSGGLPSGRIYLLQGCPGTGKTTLAMKYLLEGVSCGESSLYVTLSETAEELNEVAVSHGWDISGLALHELTTGAQRLAAQEQNTLFHPAEVELNETIERVMALVESTHPKRLVFDSLSEMRLLAGEPLSYRRQILSLKQRLAARACTVLFLDDNTAEAGADLQLQSLAHGVIALNRDSSEFGGVRRHLEIIKMRGVCYLSGRHDFTIVQGGLQVHPRLVASQHHRSFKHSVLSSGSPELDALQGGGLVRGTTTLLVGPSGSGKSTVSACYVEAMLQRNQSVVMFNFEENFKTFFARAHGVGIDLERHVTSKHLVVQQIDPAELTPGEFVARARVQVEQHGAQMVVIDSLNGFLNAMPDSRFLLLQMHELLTYLNQMGCTTLVVLAQHGLLGHMETPVDLTYLADAVVLFRFFEAAGRMRKALSVVKKRIGGHEDTIRELRITNEGIRIGPALEAFHGVLTGTPAFVGAAGTLLPDLE